MISIRQRTDADFEACVSALQTVKETEDYPTGNNRDLRKFLSGDKVRQAWIAESDGVIVGHISTGIADDLAITRWKELHPNDEAYSLMSRLFVLPAYRKEGVAAKLVDAAVEFHAKQGTRLLLSAMFVTPAAVRLYDRLGWERFGTGTIRLPDGTDREAVCFASPLQN